MNKEEKKSNKCPICGRPTHKESKYCIFHASAMEKTEYEFKKALKEYIQEIKEGNKDYHFKKFIFIGNINFTKDLYIDIFKKANFEGATFEGYTTSFEGATFEGVTSFREAIFKDYASFTEATFEGNAVFEGATFEGVTSFWEATFKGNASFREATFKIDADFREAIFKGYSDFTEATFKIDAGFREAIFKGYAIFTKATFEGNADFEKTTFEGKAEFTGAIFKENTDFRSTIFLGNAYFTFATFKGKADFTEATFKISTEFKGTAFEGNSNFEGTTFKGHSTYFTNAIFEGDANFFVAKFKGNANFKEATFKEDAYFEEATFEGDADFRLKYLIKILNLSKIKTYSGKKLFIKLNNEGGKILFKRAYLENTYLDIELVEGLLVDFIDALLRNTKIKKKQMENHILQEKEKEFSKAEEIYLLLKNNFHSIGRYDDESWAYKKERDMERKSNCHFKTLHKWLWSCFLNALYGYGEKPERVIVSAIAIIIIFAFVFMNFGIDASPQLDTIPKYNILKELFMGIRYGDLLVRLKDISLEQIKNCLYFSTVTFTTLGLGDFRPVEGWSRILVGAEAFIGALMMALFIYTFARRTGGR